MPIAPISSQLRRPALPAWLLSCILHLGLCLILVWLIHTERRGATLERDRSGGIALATVTANDVDYFHATEDAPSEATSEAEAAPETKIIATLPAESAAKQLISAKWDLPGTVAVTGDDERLPAPDLRARGALHLPSSNDHSKILAAEAERRRRQAALGPTAQVSVFGSAEAKGRSFVFVIDRSNSMGGEGLGALRVARAEFQRALTALIAEHKFQIVAYHHQRVRMGDGKLIPATPAAKKQVEPFLRGLAAFGGTDHMMAIASALAMHPDVIFLLTDGGDPPLSAGQLTMIHRQAAGRTTIHCIQFGKQSSAPEEHFMRRLAEQNQGSYRYVSMSGR